MADTPDFQEQKIEVEDEVQIEDSFGMLESFDGTATGEPEWTPTKFSEQFATDYINNKLCVYDWTDNAWHCMTTQETTIAKSGSTALSGDVTLSEGTGIDLTQVGQDIEIDGTTIAKSGSSALNGAVTFSEGDGITLTQASQDIEVALTAPKVYVGFYDTSYALTAAEVKDYTISCGFEPKSIIGYARVSNAAFTGSTWMTIGSTGDSFFHPCMWANTDNQGTGSATYRGFKFTTGGSGNTEALSSQLWEISTPSEPDEAHFSVTSETSSGFDFTLTRSAGTGTYTVYWQMQYMVFG